MRSRPSVVLGAGSRKSAGVAHCERSKVRKPALRGRLAVTDPRLGNLNVGRMVYNYLSSTIRFCFAAGVGIQMFTNMRNS